MLYMRDKRTAKSWVHRLRAIRKRLGLSQSQAAKKLEVPVATWRNWEQGRNAPHAGMARLIEIIFPAK